MACYNKPILSLLFTYFSILSTAVDRISYLRRKCKNCERGQLCNSLLICGKENPNHQLVI